MSRIKRKSQTDIMDFKTNKSAEHVRSFWSNNKVDFFSWDLGPIKESLPDFKVARVTPKSTDEPWVYISCGISEIEYDNQNSMEFLILSPYETPIHVETLAMLAHLHSDPRYYVQLGNSIDIGREWIKKSNMQHFLLSLPYPYGPQLEVCDLGKGKIIQFLWLLPITSEEVDFLNQNGLEALERKFDENEIDAIKIKRKSVV